MDTFIRNSKGNYWTATGANLKLAWWDLNTTGGTVWLPAGIFIVTADLTPVNKTKLIGAGIGATHIDLSTGTAYGIKTTTGTSPIRGWRNNFTISDMTIDANSISGNCLNLNSCNDVILENLYLNGSKSTDLYLSTNCTRFKIMNIYATGLKDIAGSAKQLIGVNYLRDSLFDNIHCFGPTDGLCAFDLSSGCQNNSINNVYISKVNTLAAFSGFKLSGDDFLNCNNNINNVRISGCQGTTSTGKGFYTQGTSGKGVTRCNFNNIEIINGGSFYIDAYGSYINVNNVYVNNSLAAGQGIGCLGNHINFDNIFSYYAVSRGVLFQNANNITINNMQVIHSGSYNQITGCTDFSLSNCIFSYGLNSASGDLSISTCSRFTITNSRFMYNLGDGIDTTVGVVSNFSISNCQFIGNVGKGIDGGANSNLSILGCLFNNNGGDGIECDALDSVIITNCIMYGDSFDDNIIGTHKIVGSTLNLGMVTI
jgi:hypothetical protein